jgi:ABC-type glycerol-3-phosphate transport system permease component
MKHKNDTILTVISYTVIIAFVLLTLLPLAWIVSTSIKTTAEVFARPPVWIPSDPTVANYRNVLFDSSIPLAFYNSLMIGLMTSFLALVLGGNAGYAFARFNFRGNKFLSMFMLLSQMLPLTVLMIPVFYMQNNFGIIDTKIGMSIAHLIISLPMVTWMAKGYFKSIPKEIEEASTVDGCSTIQTMYRIIIPLLRPALAATGIYAFISSWNEYPLANVLTRSNNSRTVPIALNEFSSFFKVDWGDTMAAAAIITLPVIILFMSIQKHFVAGLSSGAVKG